MSSVVYYQNKIHFIGSQNSPYTVHYTYDPETNTFEQLPTMPISISNANKSTVVFHGKIHVLGSYRVNSKYHAVYDGENWTQLNPLPYNFYNGNALIIDDKLHIFEGNGGTNLHYVWDEENDVWKAI